MNALEWLLWFAVFCALFLAYCALDVPTLCARAAHLLAARIRSGGAR